MLRYASQAKDYEAAIAWYQKALHLDPENHILYSNRSACYCALEEYEKALKDANKCIKLNKLFLKGYSRKSSAMQGLGQKADALKALRQGLKEAEGVDGMRKQREALQDTLNELEEAVCSRVVVIFFRLSFDTPSPRPFGRACAKGCCARRGGQVGGRLNP